MKLRALSLATFLAFSAGSFSQDYQFFSNANYTSAQDSDVDSLNLGALYYFSPIDSLGPYNEFDYLITRSNISGGYSRIDTPFGDFSGINVAGELFYGDVLIGGSYSRVEDNDSGELKLGYLLSSNFLVDVSLPDSDAPYDALFSATYQHKLGSKRYIGLTASIDNSLDTVVLSSRYFTPLANGRFFSVEASYTEQANSSDDYSIGGTYYFNQSSSMGAQVSDGFFSISGGHFFTPQLRLSGSYTFTDDAPSGDVFNLNLGYQF